MIRFSDAKQCPFPGATIYMTQSGNRISGRKRSGASVARPQNVFRHYVDLYRNESVLRDRFCHQITPVLLRYSKLAGAEQPANEGACKYIRAEIIYATPKKLINMLTGKIAL